MTHIGSVFSSEQELLSALIQIHAPQGIELDPMFFKGNFYKKIPKPKYYYDINPQTPDIRQADARQLPISSNSISCMILDPPFMFGGHGKQGKYYASSTHGILPDFTSLQNLYRDILKEAHRVLDRKGILFFKCQDYTDNRTTMTHVHVHNWAVELGFYVKDLAILYLPKNKISNNKLHQRHLRKHHSYFWILEAS